MKKRSIIALILMLLCFALAFTSCGGTSNDPSDGTENGTTENGGTENGGSESDGSESADAEITGITFAGAEFTYDGTEKSIAIAGTLPEGVSVAYANEKATIYCFSFSRGIFLEYPQAMAYNPYQNYIEYKINPRPSTGKQRLEKSHHFFRNDRKH